jgi:hypothetical protein
MICFLKLGEIVRGTQICNFFGKIWPQLLQKSVKSSRGRPWKNPENNRF